MSQKAGARISAWKNHGPEWTRHCLEHVDNHAPPRGRERSARGNTQAMLGWWQWAGVVKTDLAVRRANGMMIWHHGLWIGRLPLPWARAENVRSADVYIRPARGYSWPLVFLDDLPIEDALAVARKYDSLVVKTSEPGGCHLWLSCSMPLDEAERYRAQRWLVRRVAADPASTSGEHLGRLAGFKNHKRGGVWVNLLAASRDRRKWTPVTDDVEKKRHRRRRRFRLTRPDRSPSAREWAWVCALLETGNDPLQVQGLLADRARPRRGKDAERYARMTVKKARDHILRAGVM